MKLTAENNYGFSDSAVTVLKDRYLQKNPDTKAQESIPEMFWRVASHVLPHDYNKRCQYYEMMLKRDFLPNSPTLMNAGREGMNAQLSACYVLPVEDSMDGIFTALKNMALIHKYGGGTGFNFSKLRPKGSCVGKTVGLASGPVSFMQLFDQATECVMQGGARRGANMGILNIDHPDIMDFIMSKKTGKLTNFNISVAVTNVFMKNLRAGTLTEKQREIWDAIIQNAWERGDPGLVFIDTINDFNTRHDIGVIEATNPCGETPLFPYEACNLGSINLSNFVCDCNDDSFIKPTSAFFNARYIDWDRLRYTVELAVDFLNDVITVNNYPLPEIKKAVLKTRKIGLGIMGWADMLFKLGVRYGSTMSYDLAHTVMKFINNIAHERSNGFNDSLTCIAPTGTISIIAGCSSGIEPLFALSYKRIAFDKDTDIDGNSKRVVLEFRHPEYEDALNNNDWRVFNNVFVTAHDVHPVDHIRMQAAFQKHTDLAVSMSVNLPNDATPDLIAEIYKKAWELGCKGITVFRDGCLAGQVLYKDSEAQPEQVCPECNSKDIVREGGCKRCQSCGWSPCAV